MTSAQMLDLADELHAFCASAPHDYPGHNIELFERAESALRSSASSGGVREALEFYADPFTWKKKHDPEDVVRVPDFYSETSFGDTAVEALAALSAPGAGSELTRPERGGAAG